jgi:hypothetical protein
VSAALPKSIRNARRGATYPVRAAPRTREPQEPGRRRNAAGQAAPPLLQHAACADRYRCGRKAFLARKSGTARSFTPVRAHSSVGRAADS